MNDQDAYILGIDVGGTHVDSVAVNAKEEIIAFCKERISNDVEESIMRAINTTVMSKKIASMRCKSINLGTTLAMNSLLELKSLQRVGVIRIAGHHPELPPAFNWAKEKKQAIMASFVTISGGQEHNNKPISDFNPDDVHGALEKLIEAGAESIAVVGVFSQGGV